MKTLITTLMLGALLVLTFPIVSVAQGENPTQECSECNSCTTPVAKWEREPLGMEFGGDVVTVIFSSPDLNSGKWESNDPICCVILKAGKETHRYDPPDNPLSGEFSNDDVEDKDISHITFCSKGQSVPVTLSSLTATAGDGVVILNWTTGSETENLGYHVYRSLTKDGTYERITAALIEGAGSSRTTRTYQFVDRDVQAGMTYFYELKQIDFDGQTRTYDPIGVTVAKPTLLHRTWGWVKSLLK